jgi:hypothetical protein
MTDIKAFVGHSFEEDDDPIVRIFLEYFDEVQKMGLGFSWDHAKAAESKDLAEKVLAKIQDKNLFIAICTRKERAVAANDLRSSILPWRSLAAAETSFTWKTSDWITQEIGLAIGRGMALMILLEKGVRRPGGLQGNHEYINFDRNAPERSFTQILQTIRSLMPKVSASVAETVTQDAEREPVAKEENEKGLNWLEPKDNWRRGSYVFALMHVIADDNKDGVEKIDKAYLASADAQQLGARESWEAAKEHFRLAFGKGGKLANLEKLAKAHNENSGVHKYLAMAYRDYDQNAKAAEHFQLAAEREDSDSRKMERYGDAILALIASGEKEKAKTLIDRIKELARSVDNGEQSLIKILREVAEKQKNYDTVLGLNEKLLQITPDDTDSRFKLAYRYSQANLEGVALFHYLNIHYSDRESGTWNNLGVQFNHFDLAGKAVEAFRKAEDLGETLAMSNLAFNFITGGFLREAEDICNKAMGIKNCDKRVNQAITRLKELPDEETKKQEEIISKALPLSEFFIKFGHALLQLEPPDQEGRWQGPDCELKITLKNGTFSAVGEYEWKNSGLGLINAPVGLRTAALPPTVKRFRIVYEGSVQGRAINGTVRREEIGKPVVPPTLLGGTDYESSALLVISDSMRQIVVYERVKGNKPKFYGLDHIG